MGVEYELKFRATEPVLSAIREAYGPDGQAYRMRTTYYDTPTGQLSCRKYTLRHRMENDKHVCTLKAPAQGYGRGEWETEEADIFAAISALRELGAPEDLPELTAEGLVAVCGAAFDRFAICVQLSDCTLELALDRGILTGGGRQIPLCEVEVELKSGDSRGADRFAAELARQYGLLPETKSKFRRALALSKGENL